MNKAEFKEKRKKLLEQRVRPTEGTEAVSAWDYDFNDSNEVLQSGEVELLENMTSIVPEDRPKTGEIFKEKRNKTRHKLDAPILSEQLSDYFPQGMEQNTGLGLHAIFSGDHQDGPI